jgi:hypothetical protein
MSDRRRAEWPLMTEIVEGDPIHVEGRELVPLIRMTSRVRRTAVLSNECVDARGGGFVQLRPVALLDRSDDGGQRLAIRDQTAWCIRWLLLTAIVVPCIAITLMYLSRRLGDQAT